LSSCTDEYAHTYDISTYSVSSDRVS